MRPIAFLAAAAVVAVVLGLASPAGAQSPERPPVPPSPPAVLAPPTPPVPATPAVPATPQTLPARQAPPTPATPPAPPSPMAPVPRVPLPPPPPAKPGQAINIEIELTITESAGGTPETKVVSLLAADATWGRVRSQGTLRPNPSTGVESVMLNVDARPRLVGGDTIRLELTVEYAPPIVGDGVAPSRLHQSLNVIVKSGQSLRVSQAVDPMSNRRTTVDVKATRVP